MAHTRTGPVGAQGRLTGPGSAVVKYDILTALLVTATRGDPVEARLALRLSLLITARFSWRQGTFAVGQREMARMWGVTERTAKREMAAMRALNWIVVAVPAARGRVAQYRIEMDAVLRQTMPHWDAVGPDFAARMAGGAGTEPATPSNVVPLRREGTTLPAEDGTGWPAAAERLRAQDPAIYSAWFAALTPVETEADVLTLAAPSRFVADCVRSHFQTRILAAAVTENRSLRDVNVIWIEA